MFGKGMKLYTVHAKIDVPHAEERPVFVKEGFNIFAFVFASFWALYQRLWWIAVALISLQIGLAFLSKEGWVAPVTVALVNLTVRLFVGFQANDWVRDRLQRHDYMLVDITASDSKLAAEQRYFDRVLQAA